MSSGRLICLFKQNGSTLELSAVSGVVILYVHHLALHTSLLANNILSKMFFQTSEALDARKIDSSQLAMLILMQWT